MKNLVITNKISDAPNSNLFNLFGAVSKLTNKCDVVVLGNDLTKLSECIAGYTIVDKVLTIDDVALENILADNIANQLAEVIKGYTHVMVAADNFGKNLLPRIAGILDLGQISEVTKIISPNVYQKYIYAGNVLIEVESLDDIKLLTISSGSFTENIDRTNTNPRIEILKFNTPIANNIKFVSRDIKNTSVDLSNAKLVVTGGRSLGSKANFDLNIRKLAAILNAGVGASRAAVESGFASNDCQVGQTGKIVAPDVYLAFGISGAVQHIAGMKNSRMVIAINTDQTAPIFAYADYGLVADLFAVIPELISKIEK
ncbi:MAG: electron transfer flavoprotein subunit alpha/FixB family protein [Burkholderiales bacterium]|nr:electron transfer flavoprotein subunit alpha/FixB family protein [Burkholderiales bacterium]